MPKEIIEVIDTAVKIGLGALIGSISAYVMAGRLSKLEQKKHKIEANKELIIKLAENFEQVDEGISQIAVEIRTFVNSPDDNKPEFKNLASNIAQSFKHLSITIANANLLSLNELSDNLNKYHTAINSFFNKLELFLESGDPLPAEKAFKNINEIKKEIYPLIQHAFSRLYA